MQKPDFTYEKLAASHAHLQDELHALHMRLREREDYIGQLSHQLRTPLMAVLGYGALLESDANSDSSHLGAILHAAEAMLSVIDDLPLAPNDCASLQLRPVNLAAMTAQVQGFFGFAAARKQLALHVHWDNAAPSALLADAPKLREVLLTLVHNAIRFTQRGRVSVSVTLQQSSAHDATLCFAVEDSGMGIKPEKLPTLFTPPPVSGRFGRAGKSLLRAAKLVETMGGALHVDSCEGRGSRFWFLLTLPLHQPTAYPVAEQHTAAQLRTTASVLVADDVAMNRELLCNMLHRLGIQHVAAAQDGAEAVQIAAAHLPSLILMDCQMPKTDGFAAARLIKASPVTAHIPIIGITADVIRSDTAKCFAAGMDDYQQKPLELTQLDRLLDKWLPKTEQGAKAP